MGRGRPSIEDTPPPRKYTREFTDSEGNVSTWHYDLDYFPRGPFKVEIQEAPCTLTWEEKNAKLSKTQRKYFNPANNKWIGYGRAKQLKVI